MGVGVFIVKALKAIGGWVLKNPDVALEAVDKVSHIRADWKSLNNEERFQVVDERLNQLGEAALELDRKIDTQLEAVYKQLRAMKIILYVLAALLGIAVVAIILLAIF